MCTSYSCTQFNLEVQNKELIWTDVRLAKNVVQLNLSHCRQILTTNSMLEKEINAMKKVIGVSEPAMNKGDQSM